MLDYVARFSSLEDIIVAVTAWQTWVDSADDATLRARVTWPLRAANLSDYPHINLSPGRGRWGNIAGGYDSSNNFQPSGQIIMRIWDRDDTPDDPITSFATFEGNVTALLNGMVSDAHSDSLIITSVETDDVPIVHSFDNAEYRDSEDDPDPVWMAALIVSWGVS